MLNPRALILRAPRDCSQTWKIAKSFAARNRFRIVAHHPDPDIRIAPASLVRPAVQVQLRATLADSDLGARATALALSTAAWDGGDEFELWRVLGRPLSRTPPSGTPDTSRPWVVVPPDHAVDLATVINQHPALNNCQLHTYGRAKSAAGPVCWPATPRAIWSLLGSASAVVAPPGPLSYDAYRLGLPVLAPETPHPLRPPPRFDAGLACLASDSLLESAEFSDAVVECARNGTAAAWCTPEWIRLERGERRPQRLDALKRKAHKLQRNPAQFFADSKNPFVSRIGRWFAP